MDSEKPELRQNPVSGDWVLIVPGRRKRPDQFTSKDKDVPAPKDTCPFEDPQKSGNGEALAWYSDHRKEEGSLGINWRVQVIPNKYPLVTGHEGTCPTPTPKSLHRRMAGIGFHELVIFRDHDTFLADMFPEQAEMIIRAYQDSILRHAAEECLRYVLVFHNHGSSAGASIWHPHSQIMALPIIPHDVYRSLSGARKYSEKHFACVHCQIIEYEEKTHERLVYRNDEFVVFVPFAPHEAFELRIFPLRHSARFEKINAKERLYLADALVAALRRLKKMLHNPSYNFFIHTAPVDGLNYDYYHWHVEIFPKTIRMGGVELGSGMRVVTAVPEETAELLRDA